MARFLHLGVLLSVFGACRPCVRPGAYDFYAVRSRTFVGACPDSLTGTLTFNGSTNFTFDVDDARGTCQSREVLSDEGCAFTFGCSGEDAMQEITNLSAGAQTRTDTPDLIVDESGTESGSALWSGANCFGLFSWAASKP